VEPYTPILGAPIVTDVTPITRPERATAIEESVMKYFILGLACVTCATFAKDVYVNPHVRKDGTYVQGHYQTAPDGNPFNNYSTQGNVNPYTGQQGTVNPYQYQPQPIQPYPGNNRGNSGICPYGQSC
jgi:hypothetical protein